MAEIIVWLISAAAVISLFIAFVRLISAKTEADRVVALDIVFASGVALTGAATVAQNESHFLDIGIALSIVSFVGTTLWARFIEAAGASAPRDEAPEYQGGRDKPRAVKRAGEEMEERR